MGCPDPNLIAELGVGVLPKEEWPSIAEHVASCVECRGAVELLRRSWLMGNKAGAAAIARGASFGRFTVIECIGAGAMGAVYAAYDPELDRKVALKVLHATSEQQRLVAEARAMARLAHPNVVQVLDLGVEQGRVYLAMEFVAGRTLAHWLTEQPRSQKELLRVLIEAGRGLAASHAASLTHCDFKPANVLVGYDGRLRVTDFGLARVGSPQAGAPVTSDLQHSTEMAGTPLYMSPEQWRGEAAGPAADQFSFCVVAWEALYGELPFEAGRPPTIQNLAESVLAGRLRIPPDARGVRPWLRKILSRGLSREPTQRFHSMNALLGALADDPVAVRRRVARLAVAALAVAALSIAGFHFVQQQRQFCRGAESRLAGIWNAPRKQVIRRAFAATALPYADYAWNSVERTIDAYARDWAAMHTDACVATRLRGEQSEDVLDLRMSCLSERLAELQASSDLLASADAKVVEKAVQMAAAFSPLRGCADIDSLRALLRPPRDPAARVSVEAVRAQIARAMAYEEIGKYDQGIKVAQQAVAAARAIHYAPVEAEALARLATLQMRAESSDPLIEKSLEDAFYAAESSRHDEIAARSAALMVRLLGDGGKARRAEAGRWERLARAALQRHGSDWVSQAMLEDSLGLIAADEAKYDEAIAKYRLALSLIEKVFSVDHRSIIAIHHHIGGALEGQGKYQEAIVEYRVAMANLARTYGPDHPDIGHSHNNIATILSIQGHYDDALAEANLALSGWLKAFGPDHILVAAARVNVASALQGNRRFAEAIAENRRAMAIWEKANGPADPDVANCHNNIATVHVEQGRYTEALVELRHARTILEKSLPPNHPWLLNAQVNMGDVLRHQGKYHQALAAQRPAYLLLEKTLGAEHPFTAMARAGIGQSLLELHAVPQAIEHLARAIKVLEAKAPNPVLLGEYRSWYARALTEERRNIAKARYLAYKAR